VLPSSDEMMFAELREAQRELRRAEHSTWRRQRRRQAMEDKATRWRSRRYVGTMRKEHKAGKLEANVGKMRFNRVGGLTGKILGA